MKRFNLTSFSVDHPWLVIAIVAVITLGFAIQFPKKTSDTDPKNMLPATSDVRKHIFPVCINGYLWELDGKSECNNSHNGNNEPRMVNRERSQIKSFHYAS